MNTTEESECVWIFYEETTHSGKYWIYPIARNSINISIFSSLYPCLRRHEQEFVNYFQMKISSFDYLLLLITNEITADVVESTRFISPDEKLVITLRYLSSGCRLDELRDSYKIDNIFAVAAIIRHVCKVLWSTLRNIVMPCPTQEDWLGIAEVFAKTTHFPNCIGALDGKHVRLMGPDHYSVVFMGLCDAKYRFVCVEIDACWHEDSWDFTRTALYKSLAENMLNVPRPRPVTATRKIASPYVMVAGHPFNGAKNLVVPYVERTLSCDQQTFNYRMTLPRHCAETTFGIVSKKWRILHRPLNVNVEFAGYIVGTICMLHNYVGDRDGYDYEDSLYASPLTNVTGFTTTAAVNTAECATETPARYDVRTEFADYFSGEGRFT